MFKAFVVGYRDGYDQPYDFNVGMSYESDLMQRVYDRASILGQRVARLQDAWKQPDSP